MILIKPFVLDWVATIRLL